MCYYYYYWLLLSAKLRVLATQDVIMFRRARDRYSDAHGFYTDT